VALTVRAGQARAAGALHNLSSDAAAIPLVRCAGGIPPLVALLEWGHPTYPTLKT